VPAAAPAAAVSSTTFRPAVAHVAAGVLAVAAGLVRPAAELAWPACAVLAPACAAAPACTEPQAASAMAAAAAAPAATASGRVLGRRPLPGMPVLISVAFPGRPGPRLVRRRRAGPGLFGAPVP